VSDTRFRINTENVVHETVDGEVIVIDLTNGSYYSLSGSGPAVWEMLAGGATAANIAMALGARFEAEPGAIETAVPDLLRRLVASELIIAVEAESVTPPQPPASGNGARKAFAPPVLERYTDMKDYFLLDPIHEVSPAGWPKPAA
jgi:hypothetical protein